MNLRFIISLILLISLGSAYGQTSPVVVTSIKPIHSIVSSLMSGIAEPELLLKSNNSAHTFHLKPSQIRLISDADLVITVDENFEKSNFYLNISNYLNPKFYFNLTHLVSNYSEIRNYEKMRSLLENFNKEDEIYHWYKLKKISQIIYNEQNSKQSLNYIETKFNEYSNPSTKIIYDMANIYKRNKEFEKSIKYYSLLLEKLNENSDEYADVLHKRGTSYERVGDDKNSDKDLLKSLSIKPDDPYVLNYLGYSWLERSYKIQEAIGMLNKAYNQKKNDPFIIDSVGWGYYLIGDFVNAENLNTAILQAELIICRPGYSTIMDLATLEKKAIFIPTPGQTEQEYLAHQFAKNNICFAQNQAEFNLDTALKKSKSYTGFQKTESSLTDWNSLFSIF